MSIELPQRITLDKEQAIQMFVDLIKEYPGITFGQAWDYMSIQCNFNDAWLRQFFWQALNDGRIEAGLRWELTWHGKI